MNSYSFSIDLVSAAKYQINFLKKIDRNGNLYEGEYFERALYRYEVIWLPMLQKHNYDEKLIAPIDVEWIWHVHMLCPTQYIEDMKSIANFVPNHRLKSEQEIQHYYQFSKQKWEQFSSVDYDYMNDKTQQPTFKSRIKYDIKSASSRQKAFYYNVSLPHFKNDDFLKLGIERYKKFLQLKSELPNLFIVPCYLIDIIWHSHQLHPSSYRQDVMKILGFVLPHDDSVNDRSPGSKLNVSSDMTCKEWKEVSLKFNI
jgi:hypothetical protein